jgi:hypothetical protein
MTIEPVKAENKPESKSFMEEIMQAEEKTRFTLMLELLKMANLEFITEYPNFTYTKHMTKLATWRESVKEVFGLSEEESDVIVKEMSEQFMKKNVSHKRRRSHELVNALRGEDSNNNVLDHERKGFRRFLGLR